jgi:hypothetical protein
VASQDIGQESALNPNGFSTPVTTVVRKVTKRHSVSRPKEAEKGKASTKSVKKVNGRGSKPHQVIVVTPTQKVQSAARASIKSKVCA